MHRSLFPFFSNNPGLAYLDSAATTQKLGKVVDKEAEFYFSRNAPAHRSSYSLAFECTEEFEAARSDAASFINARPRELAFTSSATASFNILAASLALEEDPQSPLYIRDGDEILLSCAEHNSVFLPLQNLAKIRGARLRFIPMSEEGAVEGWEAAINERTRLVAVSRLSNMTGAFAPISLISTAAHSAGALVLSDICQAVAHERVDVKKLGIDFAAFSAHKIYGPTGLGFLYGREDLFKLLPASYFGGSMAEKAWRGKGASYKEAPWRFEAGTQPVAQAVAMREAFKFLESSDLKAPAASAGLLKAASIPHVRVFGPLSPSRAPILSFEVEGVHPHDVSQFMDARGVAIRSGNLCAPLLHESFRVSSSCRASLGIYSEKWEVDKFLNALCEVRPYFFGGKIV